MLERGDGYLLSTASAAGLLANIGDASYTVTKHAAVGLAEWLAITYGDRGIKVSCLCPQGVNTDLLASGLGPGGAATTVAAQGVIEASEVADAVVAGLAEERFLILPHPEVAGYWQRKTADPDRWLAGMRRLQARFTAADPS
jgi:NAD(P)-dependent dehydrogenase (short-subunit alcohol dehydrogenase family)